MKNHKRIAEYATSILIVLVFTGMVFLMTGCSTISSLGHVARGIGDDITTAADGAKEYMQNH